MSILSDAINAIHSETAHALSINKDERVERRNQIESMYKSPFIRMAALAIHHSVGLCPDIIKSAILKPYVDANIEVVGFGFNSTVIKEEDYHVTKLLRASEDMSHQEKCEYINTISSRQDKLMDYMSSFALRQTFSIIQHPVYKDYSVVAAKQEYVKNFKPLKVFDVEHMSNLETYQKHEIIQFARLALRMSKESNLFPDILGPNNFGFTEDSRLVLVDTIPSGKYNETRRSTSIKYLDRMSKTI